VAATESQRWTHEHAVVEASGSRKTRNGYVELAVSVIHQTRIDHAGALVNATRRWDAYHASVAAIGSRMMVSVFFLADCETV
jgi:hypothetical protein